MCSLLRDIVKEVKYLKHFHTARLAVAQDVKRVDLFMLDEYRMMLIRFLAPLEGRGV